MTWKLLFSIPLVAFATALLSHGAISVFMKKQGVDEKQWAKARRAVVARFTILWTFLWTVILLLSRYSNQH